MPLKLNVLEFHKIKKYKFNLKILRIIFIKRQDNFITIFVSNYLIFTIKVITV